jgi:hypothetical protein
MGIRRRLFVGALVVVACGAAKPAHASTCYARRG